MELRTVIRHILGYAVGFTIFLVCLPAVIYFIASYSHQLISAGIIGNTIIRVLVSVVLLLIGLIFMIWSNVALLMIGKGGPVDAFNVSISPRTQHLVVKGPYRYTRNPMVFGALCCYMAFALYLNSLVVVVFILASVPVITIYLKKTEEKRLEHDFGEEFREYSKRVSMLLPLPPYK
jgi:protein-S-isoprenylcysteine O-methyltransferase Ste14